MTTISTPHYLLDQAKRRFTPTPNTLPGMGALEKRLKAKEWDQFVFAEPPGRQRPEADPGRLRLAGHRPHDRDLPRRS